MIIPARTTHVMQLLEVMPLSRQDTVRCLLLIIIAGNCGLLLLQITDTVDSINTTILVGSFLTLTGFYIELLLMRLYCNAEYFKGMPSFTGSGNYYQHGLTFDASSVLLTDAQDITASLLTSTYGTHIYVRAELSKEVVANFLQSPRTKIAIDTIALRADAPMTLIDIVEHILMLDADFHQFLTSQGVTADTFRGATTMVLAHYYEKKRHERWWGRDQLSRIRPLGKSLTTGAWINHIPHVHSFASDPTPSTPAESKLISKIEQILQSRRDSNAALSAPDHDTLNSVLQKLQWSMKHGGLGSINGVFLATIDHTSILGSGLSGIAIEDVLRGIITKAARAGTVTFVLERVPTLIERYAEHGVTFTHVLEEMLMADRAHILIAATADERLLLQQHHLELLKRCQEVTAHTLTETELITDAVKIIDVLENEKNVIFTYGSVQATVHVIMNQERGTDTTLEAILRGLLAQADSDAIISTVDAERYLAHTFNIAIGPIDDAERDRLMQLETIMHQHIVGQERAIHAVAGSLRRKRAGLSDSKPVTSFLFLGPTGVGKTETAKVLARYYLNSEDSLIRFDMTEFSNEDSVARLLGTESETGRLMDHITHHPRSLILLDEFEKAHDQVQHLFLQILDEGYITNGQGRRVSLTGSLIIATSNAGSDLIARTRDKRGAAPILDTTIIDHIIKEHSFTAELIGRFDDVIIFDPLTLSQQRAIAQQQITVLEQQLMQRGFSLNVTDAALDKILSSTDNARFGARSIRHHISTKIGDAIATEIIRGNTERGGTITIDAFQIV